jgi:hypothetical protein
VKATNARSSQKVRIGSSSSTKKERCGKFHVNVTFVEPMNDRVSKTITCNNLHSVMLNVMISVFNDLRQLAPKTLNNLCL